MQTVAESLGNARYGALQVWLASPAQRVRKVLEVTAAWWWPDGAPVDAKAAQRAARGRREASPAHRRSLRKGLTESA